MKKTYHRSYFFDQGIRFECQRCGDCCTGEPGIIYVDNDEVLRIAEYLSIRRSDFIKTYLYPVREGHSIREHDDGRCFFYEDGCKIYPVRPNQCITFPFWFENLRSFKKWQQISRECPGIGCGRSYSKTQIIEIVHSNMDAVIKRHVTDNASYRLDQKHNIKVPNG